MANATSFDTLRQQIRQSKFSPVYILHGEEGYFIDELVKDFENILPEADREFNQYVLYAPQVVPGQVMDICGRYPMMAERQLVILKEAQAVRADQINRLYKYVQNPSPTTILVIVFRGAQAKGKELMAAAKSNAVIFESKRISDYQLTPMIAAYIKQKGLTAEQKSLEMLKDFIGADLSRMFNEIDKVASLLPPHAAITPEVIERNIGISKEFNNFELVDALANKDMGKAMRIAEYFSSNPKVNPLVMTTASLYGFFSDLLVAYYAKDKTDKGLMEALKLKSAFPLRRFKTGMRNYNAFQVIEAIWALRQFDVRSKGNGSRQKEHDLFHDLIFHIITAPGNLGL